MPVRVYVHLTWTTLQRQPLINAEVAGFRRVSLKPGESRTVEFALTPKELGLYDQRMKFVVEPGKFRVYVGGSSVGGLEGEFEVRAGAGAGGR